MAARARRISRARRSSCREQSFRPSSERSITQVTDLQTQQEQLTDSEQKLRAKIEAFRTKKEVIKAQYSAAEAQVRISEAATGVGEQMADVGLAMQRAVDKTEQMKARAGAVQELEAAGTFDDLTALGPGEDDIDRQLRALSTGSEVDDELAKMKAELGSGIAGRGPSVSWLPAPLSRHLRPRPPRSQRRDCPDLNGRPVRG